MRSFAAVFAITILARGQSTKAELLGLVRDTSGLPVSNATAMLRGLDTGFAASASTTRDGAYQFLALPAGRFALSISKEGFAPLVRDGIELQTGVRVSIDVELQPAGSSETMEVTASAPLLQSGRGSVGFTVDQRRVVNLPLDGRNFVPLIALTPGVNLPPGGLLPRINGSRPRVSEYIYDGISVLQPEPGQVALYPIIDAIAEFRVETNSYSAEYGRSNGGVIMVNQKSGSNEFRGTLFEFLRNEKLNARNLFAGAGPKSRFRRNQFGVVLGGPVQRNRTFFFAAWQTSKLQTGVTRISTVPTLAQRGGIFTAPVFDPAGGRRLAFPENTIPQSRFDAAAASLANRYPAPTNTARANNYSRTANEANDATQADGRIDRYLGQRHRVFVRYSWLHDESRPATPLPDGSGNLTMGVTGNAVTRSGSLAAEHTAAISAASVNQFRFGYTRRNFDRSPVAGALATHDITGFQQLGPPSSSNAAFATSVTQFLDNYSWVRSGHSIKSGADIRLQALDVRQPANPLGNYRFNDIFTSGLTPAGSIIANTGNSFASFLTGQVASFSIDVQPRAIQPRARIAEFFLQDDWRLSRRFTLNLGVRHTLNFPSTVVGDRGAVFNLATQKLDFLGAGGFSRSARKLEPANFAPRAGAAWKASESFVIRAGYGLTWIEQAGITTPFTTPFFPFAQTLGQQSLDNIEPAFVLAGGPTVAAQSPNPDAGLGQGVFGVQRDNGSGYAQQWNFTLQKTFGENWSLEGGYLGSKLTRLGVPDVNLNQLGVEQLALGASLTQQLPNPYFGQIPAGSSLGAPTIARAQLLRPYPRFTTVALYRNNTGHSTYHSVQTRIERRFSRGITFTAAYTFSRLIDDAGAVFDSAVLTGPVSNFQAADSFRKRLEKDVSTGSVPHVLSSGFVCESPFRSRLLRGWRIAGIVRAQAGSPIAVTQATNWNAFAGFGILRPNRLRDPGLPAAQRNTARWFDTAAFTQAPQFTLGNSSRNPVAGPGYRTIDLMVGKTFAISERLRAEFRAEAFNAANTPPLGNPNGSFGAVAFGSITSALDPRVFEAVVKIHF